MRCYSKTTTDMPSLADFQFWTHCVFPLKVTSIAWGVAVGKYWSTPSRNGKAVNSPIFVPSVCALLLPSYKKKAILELAAEDIVGVDRLSSFTCRLSRPVITA